MSERSKVTCKYVNAEGIRCTRKTGNQLGYCAQHRHEAIALLRNELRCNNCTIKDACPMVDLDGRRRGRICYYERHGEISDISTKERLDKIWSQKIKDEDKVVRRLERFMSVETNKDFLRSYVNLIDNLMKHIKEYASFKGWNETKLPMDERKERLEILKSVLNPNRKKIVKEDDANGLIEAIFIKPQVDDGSESTLEESDDIDGDITEDMPTDIYDNIIDDTPTVVVQPDTTELQTDVVEEPEEAVVVVEETTVTAGAEVQLAEDTAHVDAPSEPTASIEQKPTEKKVEVEQVVAVV